MKTYPLYSIYLYGIIIICFTDPVLLWNQYILLTEIEQAFNDLKGKLSIRSIYHQKDRRIEANIFVAFQAYCLNVTLKQRLKVLAPGLTQRAVIEKFKKLQMVDVHLPATDGRNLVLTRYSQPALPVRRTQTGKGA